MSSTCSATASGGLEHEHRSVDTVVDAISTVADDLEHGRRVDPALLSDVILFLRIFAGQCETAKENVALSPELDAKCQAGADVAASIARHAQRCRCQVGEVLA